jgi:hypothetical protein
MDGTFRYRDPIMSQLVNCHWTGMMTMDRDLDVMLHPADVLCVYAPCQTQSSARVTDLSSTPVDGTNLG